MGKHIGFAPTSAHSGGGKLGRVARKKAKAKSAKGGGKAEKEEESDEDS
eukprot:NODE_10054_length_219_cov_231.729412_g9439_i0.p4 GENE.NODE_10054_length_219_cov_231.729412_g9439_i0~~NODE_10054_length_219_cov_231.729412_g9439_i0.p4  ORF type:complete len:57 (-),score=37.38 NODE_10054_length_219_cov_231.729412_g9439_i0:49-195(-)